MLEVQIENIIPVTEARDKFNQIVDAVEGTEELYVLTKNGKPAAIVVGVHHLEKLTGETNTAVFGTEENNSPQEAAAPSEQFAAPAATAPAPAYDEIPSTPISTPVTDPAPVPIINDSALPETPTEQLQTPVSPAPSSGITFDSMPAQTPVSPVPVSIPQDADSTSNPIGSAFVDPSSSTAGQAMAPDAITPDQAGPSTDPFAIPTEPLDLPEDNQVQAAPAPTPGQTQ